MTVDALYLLGLRTEFVTTRHKLLSDYHNRRLLAVNTIVKGIEAIDHAQIYGRWAGLCTDNIQV